MAKVSGFTARINTELDGAEYVMLADTDAVYNTITAATISSDATDESFNDSANGLAGFKVGTTIVTSGFVDASLNGTFTIATVAASGSKITVVEDLTVTEAAGASVTINGLGVNYKMTTAELAIYTGSAGLPNPIDGATFKDSRETVFAAASSTFDVDNGNIQTRTAAANETIEVTMAAANGSILIVDYIPGAFTISFGTSINEWVGGVAPTTVEAKHRFVFTSTDGGTTVTGQSVGGIS